MIRIRASLLMVSALLLIAESSHASSASSISCANGLTPSITGYTTSGPSGSITGVPPVATPVEACAAWWSYRGYEARYQDIGLTWGAMTTGDGPSFSVLKNTPLYTVWGVASGWSCDQRWLYLGTPEVQTCPDTSCFGQMGVTPVLKCAVGNSPPQTAYRIRIEPTSGAPDSATDLGSIEPSKTIALVARVYNQAGRLVPNVQVRLTADAVANSGGHRHDDPTRHSQHMGRLAPAGLSQGSVEQNGKVLSGSTGNEGLEFTFTAPAVAGDHRISATCTDSGVTCTQEGPDGVWVGVRGLTPIPPIPDLLPQATYQLNEADGRPVGSTDNHPANHYLTPEAITKLWNLGFRYSMIEFPNYPTLHINDASLERGGLFDLGGNWTPRPSGHYEHRRGTVVDIRANGGPGSIPLRASVFQRFEEIARLLGIDADLHGDGNNQHYHVRLRGVKE